jgi:hypothetical protein
MITIKVELVKDITIDGSSRAQSTQKESLPSLINIEARGISSHAEFVRFLEFISNTEVLFERDITQS